MQKPGSYGIYGARDFSDEHKHFNQPVTTMTLHGMHFLFSAYGNMVKGTASGLDPHFLLFGPTVRHLDLKEATCRRRSGMYGRDYVWQTARQPDSENAQTPLFAPFTSRREILEMLSRPFLER